MLQAQTAIGTAFRKAGLTEFTPLEKRFLEVCRQLFQEEAKTERRLRELLTTAARQWEGTRAPKPKPVNAPTQRALSPQERKARERSRKNAAIDITIFTTLRLGNRRLGTIRYCDLDSIIYTSRHDEAFARMLRKSRKPGNVNFTIAEIYSAAEVSAMHNEAMELAERER